MARRAPLQQRAMSLKILWKSYGMQCFMGILKNSSMSSNLWKISFVSFPNLLFLLCPIQTVLCVLFLCFFIPKDSRGDDILILCFSSSYVLRINAYWFWRKISHNSCWGSDSSDSGEWRPLPECEDSTRRLAVQDVGRDQIKQERICGARAPCQGKDTRIYIGSGQPEV